MATRKTILITGITGFVGAELAGALRAAGHAVHGLSRKPDGRENVIACDLSDPASLGLALSKIPDPDVVVHAALAANSDSGRTSYSNDITENILRALKIRAARFLHISSVSVYGEAGRRGPIGVDDELRPAGEYGRSKQEAEEMVADSGIQDYRILRLTPVYNEQRLRNLEIRVRPAAVKLRILPSPRYSVCHTKSLAAKVLELIDESETDRRILNVHDGAPVSQGDLLKRFGGPALPLPRLFTAPLYHLARLLPGTYALRCTYWKLFHDNIYE